MDLPALKIIEKLEIAVGIADERKDKNSLLKGDWIPKDIIKNIITDYYKEWDSMCDEHYKDYKINREKKNGRN